MVALPLTKIPTLIYKTTPPFCHEWQRVNHWEGVISSSYSELEASSSSSSLPSVEELSADSRRWESKTTKTRLSASYATDSSVHLTHLIRNVVKTTTKISTHVLKLVHNGSKGRLNSRRRRRRRWSRRRRRTEGRRSIILHTRPLSR